jgi:hypothetical protein
MAEEVRPHICWLYRVEDEHHFIFECPVYRFLRTVQHPEHFVGHHSLRSFMGQTDQLRVARYNRDCFQTWTYVRTLVS